MSDESVEIFRFERIPLPKRIHDKCLDCSGGSHKEVTLCPVFDCPLWEVRFGYPFGNRQYIGRMNLARENYPEELESMERAGINTAYFFTHAGNTCKESAK